MMLPDLLDVMASWPPDLVVHDSFSFAAPLAAATHDRPSVQHSISLLLPTPVYRLVEEPLASLWEQGDGFGGPPTPPGPGPEPRQDKPRRGGPD